MFPRFTIRVALLAVTAVALFSIVAAHGLRGNAWAAGVAIGVGSIAFTLLIHALWYLAAQAFTSLTERPAAVGTPPNAAPSGSARNDAKPLS